LETSNAIQRENENVAVLAILSLKDLLIK